MPHTYVDFELEIGQPTGQQYPVTLLRSPAGEARATLDWPFGELALENRLKDLQIALLSSGGVRRTVLTPAETAVQRFGAELFDLLIRDEVRNRYDVSQERANQTGAGLRIKLRIHDPRLANLPWKYLHDARSGEYLCLSRQTPLVRYLELPQVIRPLAVTPPLRILGMIAAPTDQQGLDVQVERQRLERAVAPLQADGLVELYWLEGATWRDLQRTLRRGHWHIFHFIGHGDFDPHRDEGLVLFCHPDGRGHPFTAGDLGRLLADHRTLRLAVLNACLGAQGSNRDLFSSTAATLVRRGIPAVVAMQQAITDGAAIEFTQTFYESLADGLPVDAAMSEARKAISFAVANTLEWGTPVLYSHAPDGELFDLAGYDRMTRGQDEVEPAELRPEPVGELVEPPVEGPVEAKRLSPQNVEPTPAAATRACPVETQPGDQRTHTSAGEHAVQYIIGKTTDLGQVSTINEDSMDVKTLVDGTAPTPLPIGLFVVADGMGGHEGGEVASSLAVKTTMDTLWLKVQQSMADGSSPSDYISWLHEACQAAAQSVYTQARQLHKDMGTTLVAALVVGQKAYIANVGDSRLYELNQTAILRITEDHSIGEQLVKNQVLSPEEARHHPQANLIYRSLGERANVEFDLFETELQPGDRLLLCSDGLSGQVDDQQMHTIAMAHSPQAACDQLVQAANAAGGPDNITVIIVQVK